MGMGLCYGLTADQVMEHQMGGWH